jgi:glycosyltransferase involved in cell wall biosynthesis
VVTIHDLIHERHPEQYNPIDVKIYHKKFLNACRHSDKIIAISEQTKKDIVELYGIPEGKVEVCLQSANPVFSEEASGEQKKQTRKKYQLPDQFFLYAGSIIERKNLLNICKAFYLLGDSWNIPLVVIGDGGKYKQTVKEYINEKKLNNRIIFLSENQNFKNDPAIKDPRSFAVIYQMAMALIYPSYYEGFGMPLLEAMLSRTPVITSNVSCLPEVGGDAAYYVDPANPEEIANGIKKILEAPAIADEMRSKGIRYAERFAPQKYAAHMMNIYKEVMAI